MNDPNEKKSGPTKIGSAFADFERQLREVAKIRAGDFERYDAARLSLMAMPKMPELPPIPYIPTQEERNEYQSAAVLMKAISEEAIRWKSALPAGFRPAILAILQGGVQIHVDTLSQVSFHGIKVEGRLDAAPCSLLAHQSTIQLLCYAEQEQEGQTSNPIGFIWSGGNVEV